MSNLIKTIFKSLFEGFALWRKTKDHAAIMEILRVRIIFFCVFGVVVFGTITYKLCDIMVIRNISSQHTHKRQHNQDEYNLKADIIDRNGAILATCIRTASCYADPSVIIDINEAATKLSRISGMPKPEKIKAKLRDKSKHFVWLARHVTPQIQQEIMDIGIPGIFFKKDYKRIYPHGNLFSHIIGCTDTDGHGTSGIEKKFDKELTISDISYKKLPLTVDLRIQSIVYEELQDSINKFNAIGGNAMVMNMSGEIVAMVSLPDFDPNNLKQKDMESMFNRNTLGIYEPGSTFKILNTAIALESGSATLGSTFDATTPVKIGKFSITDFRGKNRVLSLAEAFVFSSNIAAIKISQQFGMKTQQQYMKKFGILDKCSLELPEVGSPLVPRVWQEATSMTMSYGYGIAVSPLQLISSVTSIINNGVKITPTLVFHKRHYEPERVVSEKTSEIIRELMSAVVRFGTARRANVSGVEIFGKTGTAYKNAGKGYGNNGTRSRIATFLGGFPRKNPKYMMILMLDDPKPIEGTFGFATAGWNAAPTAGKIFERIVPILCESNEESEEETDLKVAKYIQLK